MCASILYICGMKYLNIKKMGWSHEDLAYALRYKNVKSFRSSRKHSEHMARIDELVGRSLSEGKVVDPKEVFSSLSKVFGGENKIKDQ